MLLHLSPERIHHKILYRLLPVFLAAALMLTSCSLTTQEDASAGESASALPESMSGLDFSEHMEISIGFWDVDDMAKAVETDGIQEYIEELFNVTITPVSVSWSNYKERYRILSATESLPDVFATLTISSSDCNDSGMYTYFIESGAVRALPEDLSAYPLLSETLDSVSYIQYTDGCYYAIPRMSFSDEELAISDAAILVRKDWMEALGWEDPESFEEFRDMCADFAAKDPDGNGADDTIGYNVSNLSALGKWVILGLAPECNVYSWVEEDGSYVPSWSTESFDTVVSAYRDLYTSGALDPDFYVKSATAVKEDFASGRLGAMEYKCSPSSLQEIKDLWDSMNDLPFEECVSILHIFPASDGIRYSNSSNAFWSESYLSSSVSDEKAARILAIFEYLLSEDGQTLIRYGIENTDYVRNEDGTITSLLETGGESLTTVLEEKYPSLALWSTLASWGVNLSDFEGGDANSLIYDDYVSELVQETYEWYRDNTVQVERPYAFLNYPKESTDLFSSSAAFDSFVSCIIGEDDPVEMWHAVLEEMEEAGLEEYIDRQNELYNSRD